ncbi:hypothetical protein LX36DRAFT_203374 [Colletotrichum falcatum]|nr:hypothetical protein LX36DRAFT_203374 [Colletotrichum falcatum]
MRWTVRKRDATIELSGMAWCCSGRQQVINCHEMSCQFCGHLLPLIKPRHIGLATYIST